MSVIDHMPYDQVVGEIKRDRRRESNEQALQQAVATVLSQLNFGRSLGQRQTEFNTHQSNYLNERDYARNRADTAQQSFSAVILPYLNASRRGETADMGQMGPPTMAQGTAPAQPGPDYSGLHNLPVGDQMNLLRFVQGERERVGGELHMQRSEAAATAIEAMAAAENHDGETATDLHTIAAALRAGIYRDPSAAIDDAHAVRVNARMARQGQGQLEQGGERLNLMSRGLDIRQQQGDEANRIRESEVNRRRVGATKDNPQYMAAKAKADRAEKALHFAQKRLDKNDGDAAAQADFDDAYDRWLRFSGELAAWKPESAAGTPAAGATPTATAQDPLAVYTSIRQQHPEWTREQVIAEAKRLTGEP